MTVLELLLLTLILTNLALLGASRLLFAIRLVAVQGWVLAVLPLLAAWPDLGWRRLAVAAVIAAVKGVFFPLLLRRALREAGVRREVEPLVGYLPSLAVGVAGLAGVLALGSRLVLPVAAASPLIVPVALYTVLTGWFLIVARTKALTQVLGYLVMENGIYAFGSALAPEQPWLIELGILLDVFVAVFIMGIMIFHISREFDHMDTFRLSRLRDWYPGRRPAGSGESE